MTMKTNLGLCILGSCEGDIRAARRCSGFSSPLRVDFVTLLFFIFLIFSSESCHCYFVICYVSFFIFLSSLLKVVFVTLLFSFIFASEIFFCCHFVRHCAHHFCDRNQVHQHTIIASLTVRLSPVKGEVLVDPVLSNRFPHLDKQ